MRLLVLLAVICGCRPASVLSVRVDVVSDMVLHRLVTITLTSPDVVRLECEDKEGELHRFESNEANTVHEIAVVGIRANRAYACTASSGPLSTQFDFRTDDLPDWLPEVSTTGNMTGYLLTHHQVGRKGGETDAKVILYDGSGEVRWYYRLDRGPTDLDVQHVPGVGVLFGGGYDVQPTLVNWLGETLFEAKPLGILGGDYHHHAGWVPGEGILALSRVADTFEGVAHEGFVVELLDPDSGELAWSWHSLTALQAGTLELDSDNADVFHANWVDFYGEEMWVELRNQNQIISVDRASGEVNWALGPGRDFGLIGDGGGPGHSDDWFFTSHGPDYRDRELLLYDNGVGRMGGGGSRGLIYFLDFDKMTARLIWEFEEEGWYEPIWGDADFVGEDQILLTRAHCPDCSKTGTGTSRFTLVGRESLEIDWELAFLGETDAAYRSEIIDSCDVFNNRTLCQD